MTDPIVQAKARAATKWVLYANAHAEETGEQVMGLCAWFPMMLFCRAPRWPD